MCVAPPELWILRAAASYKHRAPPELKTGSATRRHRDHCKLKWSALAKERTLR